MSDHPFSSSIGDILNAISCKVIFVILALLCCIPAVDAQTTPLTPDPRIPTLESQITAQQNTIAAQQVKIDALQNEFKDAERDMSYALGQRVAELDERTRNVAVGIALVGIVAGLLGIAGWQSIPGRVEKYFYSNIDKALYQLDPIQLAIYVRNGDNTTDKVHMEEWRDIMNRVYNRMQLAGFKNLQRFEHYSENNLIGISIIPIANREDEDKFVEFLNSKHKMPLEPHRAGFVLYTTDHRVTGKTLAMYPNLATANLPTTAVTAILGVARGLRAEGSLTTASRLKRLFTRRRS